MLYPWQHSAWQTLQNAMTASATLWAKLPHALLITGEQGIGKLAFARHLAQTLLCETPASQDAPCGVCLACGWFASGNHPDFRELAPAVEDEGNEDDGAKTKKKASAWIGVDQVRDIEQFVHLSAHRASTGRIARRIVLIHPAETLNAASANALLKTLEEPPADVVFILVSHQWRRLLPTIRSRCRRLPLGLPPHPQALAWLSGQAEIANATDAEAHLAEAGGAPLVALQRADATLLAARQAFLADLAKPKSFDALLLAEKLDKQKMPVGQVTDWLARWLYDVLSLKMMRAIRYHPNAHEQLTQLATRAQPVRLLRYQDQLLAAKRLAEHPLNGRLVFEQLLLGYQQAFKEAPREAAA